MEVKVELTKQFDYDLWANQIWFPYCSESPMKEVIEHVLRASLTWLERCGGQTMFEAEDPWQLTEDINKAWKEHISNADLDEKVVYQNRLGVTYSSVRQDIIRHVLNHGTYHRGQIRTMVEQTGEVEIPDTDYILYLWNCDR